MMEKLLTDINRNEVLKYLGYKGGIIDEEIEMTIEEAITSILKVAVPRYTYSIFDIEEGKPLKGTLFMPLGGDAADLLKSCHKCIMMAATLGIEFENLLKRMQIKDMTKAVILDSCASSAIENICNNIEDKLRDEYGKKGLYLTDRFSPGYGDMPLSQQKQFIDVLATAKKIGLSVTSGGMLVPTKSVTAIIGVSTVEQAKRKKGCEYCTSFANCAFRREGKICD